MWSVDQRALYQQQLHRRQVDGHNLTLGIGVESPAMQFSPEAMVQLPVMSSTPVPFHGLVQPAIFSLDTTHAAPLNTSQYPFYHLVHVKDQDDALKRQYVGVPYGGSLHSILTHSLPAANVPLFRTVGAQYSGPVNVPSLVMNHPTFPQVSLLPGPAQHPTTSSQAFFQISTAAMNSRQEVVKEAAKEVTVNSRASESIQSIHPRSIPESTLSVNKTGQQDAPPSREAAKEASRKTASPPAKRKQKQVRTSKPKKKDNKWLSNLEELKEYNRENGDCIVPRGYPINPRLASWVAEQRKQYKLLIDGKPSSITPKRVALLNELDFAWNAQSAAWERHMDDLKKFREENGHCHVPLNHPKYPKLGLWVKEQRRHYTLLKQNKQSHMTQQRADELDKVGFCWDTHEATWLERLKELSNYKETHGNCNVPTNFGSNPRLGTWVHHQRRQYKKYKEGKVCHITDDRIKALENLGFSWYPRDYELSADENESCDEDEDEVDKDDEEEDDDEEDCASIQTESDGSTRSAGSRPK